MFLVFPVPSSCIPFSLSHLGHSWHLIAVHYQPKLVLNFAPQPNLSVMYLPPDKAFEESLRNDI